MLDPCPASISRYGFVGTTILASVVATFHLHGLDANQFRKRG
jgi:hypothetical protein